MAVTYLLTVTDDREIIKQGVPKDVKHAWTKRKTLEKQNIYRLAFITKMSFTRLVQFMMFNEKSFNPYDELDMFVLKYFLGGYFYKCYKLIEFSILCYNECKVKLEFNRNN